MRLYGKKYAKVWIDNYESRKDIYRVKYLEPYLKKFIKQTPSKSKILDVGCGWGTVDKFLKKSHEYSGIDLTKEFFKYINTKFKHENLKLKIGSLPNDVKFKDNYFDLVICSLVLHTVPNLDDSIKKLFSKSKIGGEVLIIDFNDETEKYIKKKGFDTVSVKKKGYMSGTYLLPSGIIFPAEVYFYNEKDYEKNIKKYATFKKKKVGPLFVAYECKRIK
jgi:ubiquinone/menaquinone biosynthesis C-methylase UbiE